MVLLLHLLAVLQVAERVSTSVTGQLQPKPSNAVDMESVGWFSVGVSILPGISGTLLSFLAVLAPLITSLTYFRPIHQFSLGNTPENVPFPVTALNSFPVWIIYASMLKPFTPTSRSKMRG